MYDVCNYHDEVIKSIADSDASNLKNNWFITSAMERRKDESLNTFVWNTINAQLVV